MTSAMRSKLSEARTAADKSVKDKSTSTPLSELLPSLHLVDPPAAASADQPDRSGGRAACRGASIGQRPTHCCPADQSTGACGGRPVGHPVVAAGSDGHRGREPATSRTDD